MDKRDTLDKGASFLDILKDCMERRQQVAILYDDKGLTRAGGRVTGITQGSPVTFQLDQGMPIAVDTVIAVNGIFLDNYTEC